MSWLQFDLEYIQIGSREKAVWGVGCSTGCRGQLSSINRPCLAYIDMETEAWAPFGEATEIEYSPEQPQGQFHWDTERKLQKSKEKATFPSQLRRQWELKIRHWLINTLLQAPGDNIAKRHFSHKSASDLSQLPPEPVNQPPIDLTLIPDPDIQLRQLRCYGCSTRTAVVHRVYFFSCPQCGDLFLEKRTQTRDLTGHWSVVVGGRTKMGYQVVLKLVRAGAKCVVTTRQVDRAKALFRLEPDYNDWNERLFVYPQGLDLLSPALTSRLQELVAYIASHTDHIDILVNCAAQTIRAFNELRETEGINRYGDPANLKGAESSWTLRLHEVSFEEWKETFTVSAIAPALILSALLPLLRAESTSVPRPLLPHFAYVINVHSREGLLNVRKGHKHIHTNMAKTALAMLTRSLSVPWSLRRSGLYSQHRLIRVLGVDPGWSSTEEYLEAGCSVLIPPMDEVDAAARVLQPVWEQLPSDGKTLRHYRSREY